MLIRVTVYNVLWKSKLRLHRRELLQRRLHEMKCLESRWNTVKTEDRMWGKQRQHICVFLSRKPLNHPCMCVCVFLHLIRWSIEGKTGFDVTSAPFSWADNILLAWGSPLCSLTLTTPMSGTLFIPTNLKPHNTSSAAVIYWHKHSINQPAN